MKKHEVLGLMRRFLEHQEFLFAQSKGYYGNFVHEDDDNLYYIIKHHAKLTVCKSYITVTSDYGLDWMANKLSRYLYEVIAKDNLFSMRVQHTKSTGQSVIEPIKWFDVQNADPEKCTAYLRNSSPVHNIVTYSIVGKPDFLKSLSIILRHSAILTNDKGELTILNGGLSDGPVNLDKYVHSRL